MALNIQGMVRLKFSGRSLDDNDFWTTSDPFLVLSRPARDGNEWVQVRLITENLFKQKKNPVFASSQITSSFALTTRQSSFLMVCSRVCVYEQHGLFLKLVTVLHRYRTYNAEAV